MRRLTNAQIIERFRKVHGDTYLYDRVKYTGGKVKVEIGCRVPGHGYFSMEPNNHIYGKQGCPTCWNEVRGNVHRNSLSKVLDTLRSVFGDKYDLSLIKEYINNSTPLPMRCPKHGVWKAMYLNLQDGHGCPKCAAEANGKRSTHTTEQVKDAIRAVHGDRYDLSEYEYEGNEVKGKAICPTHGAFWITPAAFKQGSKCPECSKIESADKRRKDKEHFIAAARAVHGDKYIYDEFEYVRNDVKGKIICPEHGAFMMTPASHYGGSECQTCARETSAAKRTHEQERVWEAIRAVHGDKYDLTNSVYVKNEEKMEVRCPEHGAFMITPNALKAGSGCRGCAKLGFQVTKPGIVYLINVFCPNDGDRSKVGITNLTVDKRYSNEQTVEYEQVQVWGFASGANAWNAEQEITALFSARGLQYTGPSPFKYTGTAEMFVPDAAMLIDDVHRICLKHGGVAGKEAADFHEAPSDAAE